MLDLRNQEIMLGQEVWFIELSRGSFHRREGTVIGFTPQKVRIMAKPRWGTQDRIELKQPEYIIIK